LCVISNCALAQNTKITVVSWNIGHFANGENCATAITYAAAPQKQQAYQKVINDLKADIMAVVEYEPQFVEETGETPAMDARNAVFKYFDDVHLGPKYAYNCNCLFSKEISGFNEKVMKFADMVQKRYYLCATYKIDGKNVKVISTHLDWNEGASGASCRASQIREIIEAFKDEPYVIMCADWNVGKTEEYDAFLKAGYQMANHGASGDIPTYPAKAPRTCLDNIIAKGFTIDSVKIINEPELSDHCIIKADLQLAK